MKRRTPSRSVLVFSFLMCFSSLAVLAARTRTFNLLFAAVAGLALAHLQVGLGHPFHRDLALARAAVLAIFAVLVPLFGPLLVAGGILTIFAILRLLDGGWFRTPRASFFLCLVILLLGLQLRQDVLVAGWLLLFLAASAGFLSGAERELVRSPQTAAAATPRPGRFFRAQLASALRLCLLALPIFLLIPRVGLHLYLFHGQGIPAFSGRGISLDSLEDLRQSNDVLMRVFVSPPRSDYYRARSFNIYSPRSRRWYSMPNRHWRLERDGDGVPIPDRRALARDSGEVELEQEYLLSPALAGSFFAVHRAEWTNYGQGACSYDDLDNLQSLGGRVGSLRYKVRSRVHAGYPPGLDQVLPPPEGQAVLAYLQVPRTLWRLRALAGRVAGDLPTSLERALAIENYLRTEYQYTLLLSDAYHRIDGDPIEHFLFEARKGHCELFASAMVLMLRSVGVAARLTEGFAPGEYQPDGDYYVVRGRNAHAWVEAYFPGFGWFRFDPTGFQDAAPEGGSGWLAPLRRGLERVNFFFDTWISGYSQEGLRQVFQRAMVAGADLAEALAAGAPGGYLARVAYWTGVSFVMNFSLALLWLVLFDRRRLGGELLELPLAGRVLAASPRLRRLTGFRDEDFYLFFQERLAHRGLRRSPGRTPLSFAEREVREGQPELHKLARALAQAHDRVVYADDPRREEWIRDAWSRLALLGSPSGQQPTGDDDSRVQK